MKFITQRPRCAYKIARTGASRRELRRRARDAIMTDAIKSEETMETAADDLLNMEGMDAETAQTLAGKGVRTMDDLADLAIDELTEMTGMEADRAKNLIMTARAPWFAEKTSVEAKSKTTPEAKAVDEPVVPQI